MHIRELNDSGQAVVHFVMNGEGAFHAGTYLDDNGNRIDYVIAVKGKNSDKLLDPKCLRSYLAS